MPGAKAKMLGYMLAHVGVFIPMDRLRQVSGGISDWARQLRTLRQEGWAIEHVRSPSNGYILRSREQRSGNVRGAISARMRYLVLDRDNSKCQRCGRTLADGITLAIDHILPVEWGGLTELSNLQALCSECNQGKKDFVRAQDSEAMRAVFAQRSAYGRIKVFFERNPNTDISADILQTISKIRDWERTVRSVRATERMRIRAFKRDRVWYYRYER